MRTRSLAKEIVRDERRWLSIALKICFEVSTKYQGEHLQTPNVKSNLPSVVLTESLKEPE
jgi:hypothetical protein